MQDKTNIEQEIAQAFQSERGDLPEDQYFKRIWESIETKSPVGERYYLRSFFTLFLIVLLLGVFIFFYMDFLATVLALREIRTENITFYGSAASLPPERLSTLTPDMHMDFPGGIRITAQKDTKLFLRHPDTPAGPVGELDIYSGHMLVDTTDADRRLDVYLPDMTLHLSAGKCDIFCYDAMIRVIPLVQPVEIRCNGTSRTLNPGETCYLLARKELRIMN